MLPERAALPLAGSRVALACTSRRSGPDGVAYAGGLLVATAYGHERFRDWLGAVLGETVAAGGAR